MVVFGRIIGDVIHQTHEAFNSIRITNSKHGFLGIKLDLEKTYDKLNGDFLIFILKSPGFPNYWLSLAKACITSSSRGMYKN